MAFGFYKIQQIKSYLWFSLEPGMKNYSNRYFSKSLGSPEFKLAHAVWIGSIVSKLMLSYPQWSLAFYPAFYIMDLGNPKYLSTEDILRVLCSQISG